MPGRNPETQQEKKERMAVEGAQAMREYITNAEAVNERTARLRAERLAREAATTEPKARRKKR